jgi:hypothetical protein
MWDFVGAERNQNQKKPLGFEPWGFVHWHIRAILLQWNVLRRLPNNK